MMALKICFMPAILGVLVLACFLENVSFRYKVLFFIAAAIPIGFGICSLILFCSYLLYPAEARHLSWAITSGICVFLIWRCGPWFKRIVLFLLRSIKNWKKPQLSLFSLFQIAAGAFFIVNLYLVTQYFFLSSAANISGGWDARYFWHLKAAFMFRHPEAWQGMFSSELFWAHPDYPLLWPATLTWGWHALGYESLRVAPWIAFMFYLSCVFLLIWYIAERISLMAGWIAGTFFLTLKYYLFWAIAQYADIPVAFFITAGTMLLVFSLEQKNKNLFVLAGLMAGFSAWTKNEGLLFLIWAYLVLIVFLYLQNRQQNKRNILKPFLGFTQGAAFPLLATIFLKTLLGTTGDYLGSQRTWQDYGILLFLNPEKTLVILKTFFIYMTSYELWGSLWFLGTAGAFISGFFRKKDFPRFSWLLFVMALLVNLGYIVVFHISPYEITWQLKTALSRLLLHSGLLAMAFTFESLTWKASQSQN